MSNKTVSQTYRAIIDDVIANVRSDFEEMGIEEAVLQEMQRSWELKVVSSAVAYFHTGDAPPPTPTASTIAQRPAVAPAPAPAPPAPAVKTEPGTGGRLAFPGGSGGRIPQYDGAAEVEPAPAPVKAKSAAKLPQYDGPSDSPGSDAAPPPPVKDDEAIDSDLDDSDESDAGEGDGDDANEDIVLCLYDKVQRVKNKWKMTLKDGIISVNGKDYLFSKCTGEFEW